MKTRELETSGFIELVHEVEGLYRLTGRTFHQIVYGTDDDKPFRQGVFLEPNVTEVGAG